MDTPPKPVASKVREPDAAAPPPAAAEVDTQQDDAPQAEARRRLGRDQGFSDSQGESVSISGAAGGGDQGDY